MQYSPDHWKIYLMVCGNYCAYNNLSWFFGENSYAYPCFSMATWFGKLDLDRVNCSLYKDVYSGVYKSFYVCKSLIKGSVYTKMMTVKRNIK